MLPFRTSMTLSIIEFFCTVLLYVVYALNQYGTEQAIFISIGFLPVLLTLLLYRIVKNENAILRCFYITMSVTSYIISLRLEILGMLILVYMAQGLIIALYSRTRILVEYIVLTVVALVVVGIFQRSVITLFFPMEIYMIFMLVYCFGMVTLLFLVTGVNSYKQQMEEKNEEARQALEAKGNFLANMSHEIRTPMNAICGMAELLSQQDLPEKTLGYVTTIQNSSESLLSIINEILDFSKIDSGKMNIVEEEYHFNSLIHDVLSIIEFRMRNKSVKLNIDIDNKVPRVLVGDELRIRQVMINLLGNAVNFTHRGHITLRVRWVKNDERNGVMEVDVEDTGIGISQENITKLFVAFGQIDTRKNRNVEGTGLGLVISKTLLNLMGGDIWVKSKLKEGSTFSFRLPQKVKDSRPSNYAEDLDRIYSKNEDYVITFRAPAAKVMVVDDNKVNLEVVKEIMSGFGIEPTLVESGSEALNRIEENLVSYDLIFMDHMMPFMDGVETTQKIRALDTEYAKELPIIALTANAIKGVEKQFKAAGMDDYLAKPIRIKQLSDILQRWLPVDKVVRVLDGKEMINEEKKESQEAAAAPKKDILDCLVGIAVEEGMRNCGGSKNAYIRILQTFASSNLLASLEEYYEKEDCQNYGIIAHAIKGACLNIGAKEVADLAFKLELAGKQDNLAYIKGNHNNFAEKYRGTMQMITKAMIG